jgi:hypothetical protein
VLPRVLCWSNYAAEVTMSIESEVSDRKPEELESSVERPSVTFPCEAVPYLLSTTDALLILFASLFGGFSYHWASRTQSQTFPLILP